MPLTGKQRHALRALAHHLDPVVMVGHEGVSESVLAQIGEALAAHELIKVKLLGECPVPREEAAAAIGTALGAEIPQVIGHIVVVYKRRPKKPKVEIPTRKGEMPREKSKGSKGVKPRKRTHGRSARGAKVPKARPGRPARGGRPKR